MLSIRFIGSVIEVIGEICLGLSVYFVHRLVAKEKKIDVHIVKEFKHEKTLAIVAIILIVLGFFLQIDFS